MNPACTPQPSWTPFLPLLGTLIGALVGFLASRWALLRSDKLARERDDRVHLRAVLLERYRGQRAAVRLYARCLENADVYIDEGATVRELVRTAFEHADLADMATAALRRAVARDDIVARFRAQAFLKVMSDLTAQAREKVDIPAVSKWTPMYLSAKREQESELRAVLRDANLPDDGELDLDAG